MLRPVLALLLLLNYLLVVGMGLGVSRPAEPAPTATHPYVHSQECQRANYLRLDCFEHCNGDQHTASHRPLTTPAHLLALLRGLDEHCPAAPLRVPASATTGRQPGPAPNADPAPAVRPGFEGLTERPPC